MQYKHIGWVICYLMMVECFINLMVVKYSEVNENPNSKLCCLVQVSLDKDYTSIYNDYVPKFHLRQ